MSYTKTNWQDLPNTTTPVTAANLNNMENGIKRSDSAVGGIDYDSTATYDKGEYCIYESVLYVANQNIDTPEAFNSAHWDATAVINELETLRKSGGIPTNSIIGYDGSTIPSGFEETDGPNDCSTSEKVIGKWIDGKPLYRKEYQITLGGVNVDTGSYTVNIADINLDELTNIRGTTLGEAGSGSTYNKYWRNAMQSYAYSGTSVTEYSSAWISTNNTVLNFRYRGMSLTKAYITLEYTKTTD